VDLPKNLKRYLEDAQMAGVFVVLWRELDQLMLETSRIDQALCGVRGRVAGLRDDVAKLVGQLELPESVSKIFRFETHQKEEKDV